MPYRAVFTNKKSTISIQNKDNSNERRKNEQYFQKTYY